MAKKSKRVAKGAAKKSKPKIKKSKPKPSKAKPNKPNIDEKVRIVPAIKDGTVIDHIPSRQTFKIMKLVDPQEYEHPITIGLNLDSKKMGKKGVIKISNRLLTEEEFDKVAILAPKATVSIIKDYKVKEKIQVKIPQIIEKIVKCSNPNCITNAEPVKTKFDLVREEPLKIRCVYCERTMAREDITLN